VTKHKILIIWIDWTQHISWPCTGPGPILEVVLQLMSQHVFGCVAYVLHMRFDVGSGIIMMHCFMIDEFTVSGFPVFRVPFADFS
jgi:hypothetical protein